MDEYHFNYTTKLEKKKKKKPFSQLEISPDLFLDFTMLAAAVFFFGGNAVL
jgi:hypothetical protein